jgi:chemotaxis protein methyltransferase CheR
VSELLKMFELNSESDLVNLLSENLTTAKKNKIIDVATNNETYFFRDLKPFNTLVNEILPLLTDRNIHIWSSGCSTGQEIYSIIMKIVEAKGASFLNRVYIDATDISHNALVKAEAGHYDGLEIQRGLPIKYLTQFFNSATDDSGTWNFKSEYRKNLTFRPFNLLLDKYKVNYYNVIFCRNVLIYQSRENKEKILKNLYTALKPNGFLLLGSGESLIGFDVAFKQIKLGEMIVFHKEAE